MRPASSPRPAPCLCLLATLLLTASAAQAQAPQSRTRFLHWAYQDAAALARAADARTPLYVMGAAVVLAPLSLLDAGFDHEVREGYHGALGSYLNLTNELGGPKVNLPVAALFLVSLATDDARFQDAAFTSLQSLVYAGAVSYGLKYAVGRFRPFEHVGPHRFAPFSGRTSFPSGHTTTAFAVITPWVLYYPHPATYGLFALSTGTALARIARQKHWATDVLAGSAIGFLTAYWLTRQHQGRATRFSVTPAFGAGAVVLEIRVTL